MAINLKPEHELTIAALAATVVYSIFASGTPNLSDVRHDMPGNVNTYKATKMSAWSAIGVSAALALLANSPTVFIAGAGMTLVETWKLHAANFGSHGASESPIVAGGSNPTYSG